ncbi:MAG: hypothetical protein U1E73_11470 [Planctomycetota bacterium]
MSATGEAFVTGCRRRARTLQHRQRTTRQQACEAIAREEGFASWAELLRASLPLEHCVTMYVPRMAPFLSRWFADYDEAKLSQREEGGYLLPWRNDFFVAVPEAVRELGLDPGDPDWARIGYDWAQPRDAEAHLRLCRLRFDRMLANGEELP